jgi:RNA polymerase primary sigma factor
VYADLIEDVNSDQPHEATATRLRTGELTAALARLNPRLRHVLVLRFGLDAQAPQTLDQVGAKLGITRQRANQLEKRALHELSRLAPQLEFHLRAG